jgi:hypothetical protein
MRGRPAVAVIERTDPVEPTPYRHALVARSTLTVEDGAETFVVATTREEQVPARWMLTLGGCPPPKLISATCTSKTRPGDASKMPC